MEYGSINNDDILYIHLFMQGNVEFNENGSRVSDLVNIYQYQEQGGTCIEKKIYSLLILLFRGWTCTWVDW